jgi:hypothetical protein
MKNPRFNQLLNQAKQSVASYNGNVMQTKSQFALGNMAGSPSSIQVTNTSKTIGINISNTDSVSALYAPLFGSFTADEYPVPFNGVVDYAGTASATGRGIVLTAHSGTVAQFNRYFTNKPGVVTEINYNHGDRTQLSKEWVLLDSDGNDQQKSTIFPTNYKSPDQYAQDFIVTRNFVKQITENTTFFVKVEKAISSTEARTVSMIFTIGQIVDTSALAGVQSPIITYKASQL